MPAPEPTWRRLSHALRTTQEVAHRSRKYCLSYKYSQHRQRHPSRWTRQPPTWISSRSNAKDIRRRTAIPSANPRFHVLRRSKAIPRPAIPFSHANGTHCRRTTTCWQLGTIQILITRIAAVKCIRATNRTHTSRSVRARHRYTRNCHQHCSVWLGRRPLGCICNRSQS